MSDLKGKTRRSYKSKDYKCFKTAEESVPIFYYPRMLCGPYLAQAYSHAMERFKQWQKADPKLSL